MGNFEDAVKALVPQHCPHCADHRQLERVGGVWVCGCCGKTVMPSLAYRASLKAVPPKIWCTCAEPLGVHEPRVKNYRVAVCRRCQLLIRETDADRL